MNFPFQKQLAAYLTSLIPTKRVILHDPRQETTGLSQAISADRVLELFREADAGNPQELFALYTEMVLGDAHLQTEMAKRKLAVLGDGLSIQPVDKANADDVAAAEAIEALVENYAPGEGDGVAADFDYACSALLDGALWPVVVMEKVFRPSTGSGPVARSAGSGPGSAGPVAKPGLAYELAELVPVPPWLLDFTTGKLRIKETDATTGAVTGDFLDADPRRFIVHRGHLLSAPDFRGGPLRSAVIWWMLSALTREWWARFLDRYGSPFLLGKYDQADDASRSVLERAFQWAVRIGGLVVSKQTEVEVVQAAASQSGDAYEKFIAVCQREKSKLVLGQTLSSESQPLGIGGGASDVHEGVRQDIRQFDAARLAKTLQRQLFRQYLAINGLKGRAPRAVWGGESVAEASATGELLAKLNDAGIQLTDEGIGLLSERTGLKLERKPAPAPAGPGASGTSGALPSGPLPPDAPLPAALPLGARLRLLTTTPLLAADDANGQIAANSAADLAQAFRGALAPVRQMVQEAESAEDLHTRILTAYADWPVARVATIVESALVAFALNAANR